MEEILNKYGEVFNDELGNIHHIVAKIHVNPEAKPRFCRARSVPYALRNKVNQELDRLVKGGIIDSVEFSDWAAPIVPVLKRDGSMRLCGDYKLTINCPAKLGTYPLPNIDDIFASLSGGRKFSRLDLAHAYMQLPLHPIPRHSLQLIHKRAIGVGNGPAGPSGRPAHNRRCLAWAG